MGPRVGTDVLHNKIILPLLEIEPLFLCFPVRILVTLLTAISRLHQETPCASLLIIKFCLLTSYRVNLEAGVARNQAVSDGSVHFKVAVSGSHASDPSSAGLVLFNAEFISLVREDRVVVVCVHNNDGNTGGGSSGRRTVVCSGYCQHVVIPRLTIQRLPQVDPSAVRKDAEDTVFTPVTATR